MKSVFFALFALIFFPAAALAQTNAEDNSRELANVVRQFNDAFGDVVDGELTPSQIDQFEEMITPVGDVDAQHENMCSLVSVGSVGIGSMMWALSQPEMAAVMGDELDNLKSDIVSGSLHDWLVQLTINLTPMIDPERITAIANHECIQRPYAYALHSDVPMNSLEMVAHKRCLATNVCPGFDDEG